MINLILSVLMIISAIALVYYWIDFILRKGVQVVKEEYYIKFEKSFPIADMWIVACALLGAVGLLTEQNYGLLFSLLAAGSLIFLALMDITFNIQNKLYPLVATSSQMKFELLINVWTLGLGIALIACLLPRIAFL